MKKIAIILGLAGIISTSYGQGYVTVAGSFANSTNNTLLSAAYTGGQVNTGVFGNLGTTTSGQHYTLALLTTTVASPLTALYGAGAGVSVWTNTGPQGANNTFSGRLTINSDYATADGTAAIGTSQQWMLFAWTTSLGDYATVMADLASGSFGSTGFVGWSPVVTGAAGAAPSALPLLIAGSGTPLLSTGFTLELVQTPEPGTLALAALGGASLLMFRRKK
jgi:hypothetical protein